MKENNTLPNFKFLHQRRSLITIGIWIIFLWTFTIFFFYIIINKDFLLSPLAGIIILILFYVILEPVGIFWGVYNILRGRIKILLEINGNNFKTYKDQKLDLVFNRDQLKKIEFKYYNTLNVGIASKHSEVIFELNNKQKFKIISTDKKEASKVKEFIEFLEIYCKKYDIQFEKIIKDDFKKKNETF